MTIHDSIYRRPRKALRTWLQSNPARALVATTAVVVVAALCTLLVVQAVTHGT